MNRNFADMGIIRVKFDEDFYFFKGQLTNANFSDIFSLLSRPNGGHNVRLSKHANET